MKHLIALAAIASLAGAASAQTASYGTHHPGAPQLRGAQAHPDAYAQDHYAPRYGSHAENVQSLYGGPDDPRYDDPRYEDAPHYEGRRHQSYPDQGRHHVLRHEAHGQPYAYGPDYRGYMLPPDYVTRNTAEPFWYHVPGYRYGRELAGAPPLEDRYAGPPPGHIPRAEDGYFYDERGYQDRAYSGQDYREYAHRDYHHRDPGYRPAPGHGEFREGSDRPGHYWYEHHERLPHGQRRTVHERYGERSGYETHARYGDPRHIDRLHGYPPRWPVVLGPDFLYGPGWAGVGYGAGERTLHYSRTASHYRSADPRMHPPSAQAEAWRRGIRP